MNYLKIAGAIALVAALVWYHRHLINEGIERERTHNAQVLAEWQREADLETGRLKGRAEAAEKSYAAEVAESEEYRATHPLHGGLCPRPAVAAAMPRATTAKPIDAGGAATAAGLQPVPASDTEGRSSVDSLGLLDALAARGDRLSAQVREWQGR